MQKINYPLMISDFDGTLVCDNGEITEKNKQAIATYVKNGGAFTISTGRMPSGILPRAKELGLKGLVSCCQGSIVVDLESEKPLLEGTLPKEIAVAVCKKMEELGLHIHVYDLWDMYCNVDDAALKMYEKAVRVKAKLVTDMPMSQFLQSSSVKTYKILAMVEPEKNDAVYRALENMHFENCTVTKSAAFLVEVVNSAYSKGTAVEFLAKYYNVPIEKTVAIGDQWNDLPMLEKAGLGLAVQNAAKELKDVATVLQSTNEESAIAEAIENYGFCK